MNKQHKPLLSDANIRLDELRCVACASIAREFNTLKEDKYLTLQDVMRFCTTTFQCEEYLTECSRREIRKFGEQYLRAHLGRVIQLWLQGKK